MRDALKSKHQIYRFLAQIAMRSTLAYFWNWNYLILSILGIVIRRGWRVAITVSDLGQDNILLIDPDVMEKSSARIVLKGSGNVLKISSQCVLKSASIVLGSRCNVSLGERSQLASIDIYCADECEIFVGRGVSCTWSSRLYAHEPSRIFIGDRCLIASDVSIMTSDMHTIYDVATGERINKAQDIHIGEHVWLASSVKVMKGVKIGDNSVIGAASIVTSDVPNNCVAVGVPAKVVKEHTNWDIALR